LWSGEGALVVAGAALAGASGGASISLLWAMIAGSVPTYKAGAAIGLGNTAGQLASAASGLIYGGLLDATGGFAAIWGVAGLCALATAVGALAIARRRPADP
jgi:hypothetical protein